MTNPDALTGSGPYSLPPLLPEKYTARPASRDDAALLARFRLAMFRHIAPEPFDAAAFQALDADVLAKELASGRTLAWFVESEGRAVASAALTLYAILPKPWNPSARYGYISSLFTEPEHRRQGLARHLISLALAAAREAGCAEAALHGAPDGRPLYESLGFKATNEMRRKA